VIALTLDELAEVVGGEVTDAPGDLVVTGPAFLDSRTPEPGGLFVAFAGEHADGHDHAADAVTGGAAAVLGTRPTGVPGVVVADARAALQELARVVLERLRRDGGPRVVAITGSQGKTSAKDLLARVLGDHAPTVATRGSFNNELGLPLTVLRADASTRHLVLEMGARGLGHLTELCRIAPPDVSLVLNVGSAHLGEFGSRENIARAKGELVEALGPDGTAVLNADDPYVAAMADRTAARVTTFGRTPAADVRLLDVRLDELGRPDLDLAAGSARATVRLQLLGEHQAGNAAAVAAVALTEGLDLARVAASLEAVAALSPWRMELTERADGLVVVNDAYNANPESVRAALRTLAGMGDRSGRRTVAVLGEMRELGPDSAAEHAGIGRFADEVGIDEVLVIGTEAAPIADAAERAGTHRAETVDEAVDWLRHNVLGTDLVLVKASRGARLERVAAALTHGGDEEVHT
jgi:UDP-N-acetylmuramoyl-tripeptide--D-alanyl-D-alanine ligase